MYFEALAQGGRARLAVSEFRRLKAQQAHLIHKYDDDDEEDVDRGPPFDVDLDTTGLAPRRGRRPVGASGRGLVEADADRLGNEDGPLRPIVAPSSRVSYYPDEEEFRAEDARLGPISTTAVLAACNADPEGIPLDVPLQLLADLYQDPATRSAANITAFNAAMQACALHRNGREALHLFQTVQMERLVAPVAELLQDAGLDQDADSEMEIRNKDVEVDRMDAQVEVEVEGEGGEEKKRKSQSERGKSYRGSRSRPKRRRALPFVPTTYTYGALLRAIDGG